MDVPTKPVRVRWRAWAAAALALGILLFTLGRFFRKPDVPGDTLRWGGDAGGGAPYIFHDGAGKLTGFEADIASYLGRTLGKRMVFEQREWEMLDQDLRRGDIDLVLNGYEWFPEREREMASTIPYFTYKLQLVVKQDSPITGWDDLRSRTGGRKRSVGVLRNSAADRYVREQFGDDVEVVAPDSDQGSTGLFSQVASGGLDATVQDLPPVVYYVGAGKEFPTLRTVGVARKPTEHSQYVIFVRRRDEALREQLNQALLDGLHDGTLEKIYRSYDLWDADQDRLAQLARDWPPPLTDTPRGLGDFTLLLLRAALTTVVLAFLSMPLAMTAGLLIAVGRLYGAGWLNALLGVYVELIRGTPLLLQLFVIYYLLPNVGIYLPPFGAGVLALAINYSAYEAENYRAGLLAIPRGQMEAALALGMSRPTALRRVIVPQAVRIVIPPVTNDFISLFKDTSICSVIAVTELTARYRELMVNNPRQVLVLGLLTALLYLLMSYPLSLLARRLEKGGTR